MARRGTRKRRSRDQEDFLARIYDGRVSPSSGASAVDNGDVRCERYLIEAKTTGAPGEAPTRKPTLVSTFEKCAREAWAEGLEPLVALRFFLPDSPLASREGWVDLVVHLALEDAAR